MMPPKKGQVKTLSKIGARYAATIKNDWTAKTPQEFMAIYTPNSSVAQLALQQVTIRGVAVKELTA